MNADFFKAIDELGKQKGIPTDIIIDRVEQALTKAYKHEKEGDCEIRIILDPDKKVFRMVELKEIVDEVTDPDKQISLVDAKRITRSAKVGNICEIEVPLQKFSRISAQTAKQVIIQGIREAERGMLIEQYENKKEEIITATVYKTMTANGAVIVDTGTSRVALLPEEQIPGEVYHEGDRIKVYVIEVRRETRGPLVTLSRTHAGLVKRLFELEVPEIQDGTVEIKNIIREAGSRTKMAVASNDPNVDPIGACIGNHGIRIGDITREINGEKIDIVKYSEDPAEYISSALAPATVRDVIIEDDRSARVIADPEQLSLAIGKEGQNARLAARLTGYKIDIKAQ